jgi:hypothetical protein
MSQSDDGHSAAQILAMLYAFIALQFTARRLKILYSSSKEVFIEFTYLLPQKKQRKSFKDHQFATSAKSYLIFSISLLSIVFSNIDI